MNPVRKYLDEAANNGERFLGVDGHIDSDLYFTGSEDFFPADGVEEAPSATQSQPYIVTISNASAATVPNFDILGALKYLYSAGWNGGSLTISGVTVSSGISNVTYQEFLGQSLTNPFSVGMTYIASISGSNAQITQPVTIDTRDANGNQALKSLTPVYDPYQNLTNVIILKQPYRIDGYTKLTISSILPSVVFQIQFYPADNINLARGLAGKPVSKQFGQPRIGK